MPSHVARGREILLVVAALLMGAVATAAAVDPCTEPFAGVRSADVTYMLATPREDTVADPSRQAARFGQLADVSRIDGAGAASVNDALSGSRAVVFVPWGFDPDCNPIPWTGSWRWARPGAEGFYRARLRPNEEWLGGRPTFDVHVAVWEGFPESPWKHPMAVGRTQLSAPELFDLYALLPTPGAIASRPYGAVSDLVEWRRDAGERADRYPADVLLREAFAAAERARVRTARVPFGGTYRMRVERDGDTIATFLLRTGAAGTEPIVAAGAAGLPPLAPRPAPAYAAPVAVAGSLERLEGRAGDGGEDVCARARGLRAEANETARPGAAHAWSAEMSIPFLASCFPDHPVLRELRAHAAETGSTQADAPSSRFDGEFRQEADGRFTFRQPAALSDGTPVRIEGERVDTAALAPPPAVPGGAAR